MAVKIQRINHAFILAGALTIGVLILNAHFFDKPRALAVREVPIAFWAWRTQTPDSAEVQRAFTATNAKTLFLRAGQFDFADDKMRRIRAVSGQFPDSVELHLVYNGTRRFLRGLDVLEPGTAARIIGDTYQADVLRAEIDNSGVAGLQLDFDVPTRLLPKYAEILKALREQLPPNTKLSITGLPTWAAAESIQAVLAAVDFWIPQCYGGSIPDTASKRTPISSASDVERTIVMVRRLNKPFYAGLSAYGYAILYAKDGSLVELRGDIDPDSATGNSNLELIERGAFKGDAHASEVRYTYRAKDDLVLDGLIIRAGETLVFDLPTAASLRDAARAVRENAGDSLLGICVFRLPTNDDKTTLTIGEIAAAVNDTRTNAATAIDLESLPNGQLKLHAANTGTASAQLRDDALTIDLAVPAGSVNGVTDAMGFTAYDTLCSSNGVAAATPCSQQRANIIRLRARAWKPGTAASITLSLKTSLSQNVNAQVTTSLDDGRIATESLSIQILKSGEQYEQHTVR